MKTNISEKKKQQKKQQQQQQKTELNYTQYQTLAFTLVDARRSIFCLLIYISTYYITKLYFVIEVTLKKNWKGPAKSEVH